MKLITFFTIASSIFALGFLYSCKKSDIQSGTPPVIITKPVITINSTSIVSGGEFTNTTTITDKGIIWGTDSGSLTISTINKISNGPALTNFTDTIQVLQPNTTYYIKAYAIYSSGVSYGSAIKFTTPPTVYLAGYHGSSAAYWKDGKLFTLANGTYAHSIYVVDKDVYVAGEENSSAGLRAVYWKNGVPTYLTNGANAALANSIYVTGNDIYVAGYELNNNNANTPTAKYWKNGVPVSLTAGNSYNSGILSSICVIGSDVYATGFTSNAYLGHHIATYWKNGIAFPLSDSNNTIASSQSIFVKGNDIYVAGMEKPGLGIAGVPVAKYWKNGTGVSLTSGVQFAGNSIFAVGSDLYVAGYEYDGITGYSVAKYWKNGLPVSLTDGSKFGNAYSIFVAGSNVYVAGGEDDYFNARCWKNGALLPLEINAQFSRSVSVFVQ